MAFDWTNPSVRRLAGDLDPVQVITERARSLTLSMIQEGWPGPPYDPLWVAEQLGVEAVPDGDAPDARTVPTGAGKFGVTIEYNPNRPASRRRFSVAHEIGHLLFDDVAESTRNRQVMDRAQTDDWELELLCNIAAAEIAMPVGSFDELQETELSMRAALELRAKLDVSFEALLLRVVRLTEDPIVMFAASRSSPTEIEPFRLDYAIPSRTWAGPQPQRGLVPSDGLIDCTAIGFTSGVSRAVWPGLDRPVQMECVGAPPFPGHRWPRVLGLLYGRAAEGPARIRLVYGDATNPMGSPPWIIAHIVNDRARAWHGGFAASLRKRYPEAQEDFIRQRTSGKSRLGENFVTELAPDRAVVSMVAQAGYGPSKNPRLRYEALGVCLGQLATEAEKRGARVHMPRIGTGQAGGRWSVVSGLIDEQLAARGVPVTIYDRTSAVLKPEQRELSI